MPKVTKAKGKSGPKPDKNRDRPIHPFSRKAKKLNRKVQHYKKVETSKNARVARLEMTAEKLRWFQNEMDDRTSPYTKEELVELVLQYRNRFEDEMEQINIVHSVGKRQTQSRQHASREAAIRITKEDERNQYESSGIEVPDLIDSKHLEDFRNWEGELNLIQSLKFVNVSVSGICGLDNSSVVHKDEDESGAVDNGISEDDDEEEDGEDDEEEDGDEEDESM